MALYKDGNPVSGLNSIPRLTLAQYNALNVKHEFWIRTDAPESYKKLSADQVSYDENNTVKDKLDWVLVGTNTSNNPITLPNDFSELSIIIHETTSFDVTFQFHILKEELANTARTFRQGYYLNSSNNGSTAMSVSLTSVNAMSYYIGGSSYLANATTEVFCR